MTKRTQVAIYARISQDRSGEGLGVQRQLEDCREQARMRGWVVVEEYVDNDVSAYSGKRRPEYSRMLADIADGLRDAVIVYHTDRLHRRPIELEEFTQVCERAGVTDLVTVQQEITIGGESDMLVSRIMGAVAAQESAAKSRRQKRKMREIAESGMPHAGGSNRPFGFAEDRVTHDPVEAQIIRDLADRILAGETLISVARWLNQQGIPTVKGKVWQTSTVRDVLKNPRIWGMRTYQGTVIGPGAWEPIVSQEKGERIRQILTDPARRTNRSARSYLLSGLCRCATCGKVMVSGRARGRRIYRCRKDPGGHGCGGPTIGADMVEEWITEAVLFRLDSPELISALAQASSGSDGQVQLLDQISNDEARLEQLAASWADGDITKAEWQVARGRIKPRLDANKRQLAQLGNNAALGAFMGHGDDVRAKWESLNLTRQVAIVKAVLEYVTINRAIHVGRKGLDPQRLSPVWRV